MIGIILIGLSILWFAVYPILAYREIRKDRIRKAKREEEGYPYSYIHARQYYYFWTHFWWTLGGWAVAAVAFGIACAITAFAFYGNQPNEYTTKTTALSALSVDDTVNGRSYFLGSGYINGSQQFKFIEDHGDYLVVGQVPAGDQTQIYQDSGAAQPWYDTYEWYQDAWFLWPEWKWGDIWKDNYKFHIPEDSIISDTYEIDINK